MADNNASFAAAMESVARAVWGEPNKTLSKPGHLRWGSGGSRSVDVKAGTFYDHESVSGGGVLKLIEIEKGLKGKPAFEWIEQHAGIKIGDDRHASNSSPSGRRENGSENPAPKESQQKSSGKKTIVKTYDYTDSDGGLIYQVVRFEPKNFSQRRPSNVGDGSWLWGLDAGDYMRKGSGSDWTRFNDKNFTDWKFTQRRRFDDCVVHGLYRLQELREAITADEIIAITEGEKDADSLWSIGVAATTNSGGAKHWSPHHAAVFAGRDVIIPIDNDKAGRERGGIIAKSLKGVTRRTRVVDFSRFWHDIPEKADVSDWIQQADGNAEQLFEIIQATPDWSPPRHQSKYGRVSWADLDAPGPEHEYLIDGWLTRGDKCIVGGPSKSGKSFFSIDMGMALARQTPFFDNDIPQKCLVIYQAGEGARGVKKRLRAYRKHHNLSATDKVAFELLTSKIDLHQAEADTGPLIEEIKGIRAEYDESIPVVLFIDTLATAQGGADENSGKDMGAVMGNIDKINAQTDANVVLVHHMNAEGKKLRGHSSLYSNVDQVILVTRNETTRVRTAVLDKQKDDEDGVKIQFELMSVQVGVRDDGKAITSCVVLPVGEKDAIRKEEEAKGLSLNDNQIIFMKGLFAAARVKGFAVPPDVRASSRVESVVAYQDVRAEYARMNPIDSDTNSMTPEQLEAERKKHAEMHKKRIKAARETLQALGIIDLGQTMRGDALMDVMWWTGKPLRAFPHTQPVQKNEIHQSPLSTELQEMAHGKIPF